MRNKIPRASDEVIIMAFSNSVRDVKMCEKIAINDNLTTALELFTIAEKYAKAEEGRLFINGDPDAMVDDMKTKGKEPKRKGPTVLAVESEQKRG